MNKARRHELKMLKYKRRLRNLRLKEGPNVNLYAYRSHGKPCTCFVCKQDHKEYKRQKMKVDFLKYLGYE